MRWALLLGILVVAPGATAAPEPTLWRSEPGGLELRGFSPATSLAPLVRAVRSAVVHVEAAAAGKGRALGSGFILTPDGWVLTNAHVLGNATQVAVRLYDGGRMTARVVGRDSASDLALLRLDPEAAKPLPHVLLGDSDVLEAGDWVVAIGNPFGLSHSVSHGLVSAKQRTIGLSALDDFLQTDLLLNPGNSGGPIFNLRGEVVGVSTAQMKGGQGVGFAVPVNLAKELLPQLLRGRVVRGWLGLTAHDSEEPGAVVREVTANGPAARAGIRIGDRITAAQGHPVRTYAELVRRVALLPPGAKASLTLLREGKTLELVATLRERP